MWFLWVIPIINSLGNIACVIFVITIFGLIIIYMDEINIILNTYHIVALQCNKWDKFPNFRDMGITHQSKSEILRKNITIKILKGIHNSSRCEYIFKNNESRYIY